MDEHLIKLDPKKKLSTLIGLCSLMFFVTASASTLLSFQSLLLEKLDALSAFSLATITTAIGLSIMTPIGGKLGDMVGRRKVIIIPSALAIIFMLMTAFAPTASIYLIGRTLLGMMQGAYISAPYVLVSVMYVRKDVPKYMGYLASSMAIGAFLGPFISGIINDAGYLEWAIAFPAVFLIIAIACIMYGLPNLPGKDDIKLDIPGIILLSVVMISFVLTFNYMPQLGITNPLILAGIVVLILSLIAFVSAEKKVEAKGLSPIISMRLLKNKEYAVLLMIGVAAYFYQTPSVPYRAQVVFDVIGSDSASIVGALNLPRTLFTMVFAGMAGVWTAKKYSNQWLSIALSSGLVAIAFLPMLRITPGFPLSILFINSAITGLAEAFRAVSITPAAQDTLAPEDLSSGTALINFFNTLSSVLSGAMTGFVFNFGLPSVERGLSYVFILITIVSVIGFLLAFLYIRPKHLARVKSESEVETQ